MNAPTHPSEDELSAFVSGQLPDERAEQVEHHISTCHPCCETMMTLHADDDTFVGLLREAGTSPVIGANTTADPLTSADTVIPEALQSHSRYEIDGLVGRGGMGRVFRARHRMMDRIVALKVIHREWVRRQEAIDRFRREVKTAARLDHTNIVTAHDAEQADDLHFLVMEHVDGIDLAEAVRARGPLPVEEACDYIRQAAEGLQYAHDRGMVHRDIKPHNLMVTRDGTVKILDFGLASLAPQPTQEQPLREDADGNLTIAGAIMGTPDFISPEQAQDAHQVDGRSDIYSLGMTLYFLLSGRVPFEAGSATDKLQHHAETHPEPLTEQRADIRPELQIVVDQMTAKEPADRFPSPRDVAAALSPHAASQSAASQSAALQPASVAPAAAADNRPATRRPRSAFRRWRSVILLAMLGLGGWLLPQILAPKNSTPDEVHGSLSELDSYIAAMMTSPHDLVYLNLGEIGPERSYLTFKPIDGGLLLQLPAFPRTMFDQRQSGFASRFQEVAASLSLPTEDESEFRDGAIAGVNVKVRVTGDLATVTTRVRRLVEQTFAVTASEECEFEFRNLPSEASGKEGEGPTRVSGNQFAQECQRDERVYFGEVSNTIYLIPHDRRSEQQLQHNADVWIANINELPPGLAARLRQTHQANLATAPLPAEVAANGPQHAGQPATPKDQTNEAEAGRTLSMIESLMTNSGSHSSGEAPTFASPKDAEIAQAQMEWMFENSPELRQQVADRLIAEGRLEEAKQVLDAGRRDPDAVASLKLAQTLADSGDIRQATDAWLDAFRQDPRLLEPTHFAAFKQAGRMSELAETYTSDNLAKLPWYNVSRKLLMALLEDEATRPDGYALMQRIWITMEREHNSLLANLPATYWEQAPDLIFYARWKFVPQDFAAAGTGWEQFTIESTNDLDGSGYGSLTNMKPLYGDKAMLRELASEVEAAIASHQNWKAGLALMAVLKAETDDFPAARRWLSDLLSDAEQHPIPSRSAWVLGLALEGKEAALDQLVIRLYEMSLDNRAEDSWPLRISPLTHLAGLYADAGRKDEARQLLRQLARQDYSATPGVICVDGRNQNNAHRCTACHLQEKSLLDVQAMSSKLVDIGDPVDAWVALTRIDSSFQNAYDSDEAWVQKIAPPDLDHAYYQRYFRPIKAKAQAAVTPEILRDAVQRGILTDGRPIAARLFGTEEETDAAAATDACRIDLMMGIRGENGRATLFSPVVELLVQAASDQDAAEALDRLDAALIERPTGPRHSLDERIAAAVLAFERNQISVAQSRTAQILESLKDRAVCPEDLGLWFVGQRALSVEATRAVGERLIERARQAAAMIEGVPAEALPPARRPQD